MSVISTSAALAEARRWWRSAPKTPEIMARDGITKKQVKQYLWEHASLPFAEIPARRKGHKSDEELLRESPHVTPDGIVHLSIKAGGHHGCRVRRKTSPLGVSADVDGAEHVVGDQANSVKHLE